MADGSDTASGGPDTGEPLVDITSDGLMVDSGVTEDTIRIGLSPDLSGPVAGLATPLKEAQLVFWKTVNDEGGIGGRIVEPVVLDNAYDVEQTLENYAEFAADGADGVVMISHISGFVQNDAVAQLSQADDLLIVPMDSYSGWADPEWGGSQFELTASYCVEAMNGVAFLKQKVESDGREAKLAILGYPGEYGQDGAAGAKLSADMLGVELVYDGEAKLLPGQDHTAVIADLVASEATIVWVSSGAADLGAVFGGAIKNGMDAFWSGNNPSYNPALLGGELGPALDLFYTHSAYNAVFDANDSIGMKDMIETMTRERPFALNQDAFVRGWLEGMFAKAVLEKALENGDMTRAGVLAAAGQIELDAQGLAPNQNWLGDANSHIVRETYMYDVDLGSFFQLSLQEYAKLDDKNIAGSGLKPIPGFAPFVSGPAEDFEFTEPCFVSEP